MGKKNLILGGILTVLIVFAYVQKGPWQAWKENMGKPENFLAEVSAESLETIEIKNGDNEVALEKNEEGWKIGGTKDFYLKKSVADALQDAIKTLSRSDLEVVSDNVDKKKEFETDDSGIRVAIRQGGAEKIFMIGKSALDLSGTYVSEPNDQRTYIVNDNIRGAFSRNEWRDDQIFNFIPERADKIRFQYPKNEFEAEMIENVWKGTKPKEFPVSEEKIMEILTAVSNLKASQIPEQKFEGTGLEKNKLIVAVSGIGVEATIMVGDKDQETGLYYAKRGDSDNIYLISEETKNILETSVKDLK